MQYYIERRNNIETPDQMYDAICKATALSGFTANVFDIKERKSYIKTKKIKNISKIHHVKYDYNDKSQTKFHIWQYSYICPGKKFDIPSQPKAPKYEEKMKFFDGGEKFGFVSDKKEHSATSSHEFPCTDESCNHFNHLLNWKDILILKINVTKRESQHNLLWWLING